MRVVVVAVAVAVYRLLTTDHWLLSSSFSLPKPLALAAVRIVWYIIPRHPSHVQIHIEKIIAFGMDRFRKRFFRSSIWRGYRPDPIGAGRTVMSVPGKAGFCRCFNIRYFLNIRVASRVPVHATGNLAYGFRMETELSWASKNGDIQL